MGGVWDWGLARGLGGDAALREFGAEEEDAGDEGAGITASGHRVCREQRYSPTGRDACGEHPIQQCNGEGRTFMV